MVKQSKVVQYNYSDAIRTINVVSCVRNVQTFTRRRVIGLKLRSLFILLFGVRVTIRLLLDTGEKDDVEEYHW
jgi:hypothetical protein